MIFSSLITTNMPRKIKQYNNPFIRAKEPLEAQGFSALPNLQNAIALHQQGKLGQAEAIYRQLLETDSRNAVALHMLGVISYQTGNYQFAVDLIGRAIEINPNIASYYSNLGNALQELKQFDAAVVSYEKAISLKTDYAEAYLNLGVLQQKLKKLTLSLRNGLGIEKWQFFDQSFANDCKQFCAFSRIRHDHFAIC